MTTGTNTPGIAADACTARAAGPRSNTTVPPERNRSADGREGQGQRFDRLVLEVCVEERLEPLPFTNPPEKNANAL